MRLEAQRVRERLEGVCCSRKDCGAENVYRTEDVPAQCEQCNGPGPLTDGCCQACAATTAVAALITPKPYFSLN